ncbi:chain length determinant protein tyrosine kinase EpsG [Nitrosovibrio tenuis]|uniref:Chain length determinant protein tyrosine kinase EpsG n=1 Tax=Nitrosovibrio tenuis TaxID=1233 RepID=A0A1H7FJG7_9PROT|nr:chain length determinant protein tyrosine kinase EpsG [Nitrosovibrio tenuis]SEK26129.1 chain length determinant protein tyrosine kinase EpsG [Nitrosovibrio tenuis]
MTPVSSSIPTLKRNQTKGPGETPIHGKTHAVGSDSLIGDILIEAGRLSADNAERVSRLQVDRGKRFGDTAVDLGLLTEDDIRFALSRQFDNLYLPANDTSLSHQLVAAYKPLSPVVERLRTLRSQLMLRWFNAETRHNALAIMSPGVREGRSFIAANLSIVFSQLGERTLLVDANLRRPCQHELFKLGNNAGLSSMLAGRIGNEVIARVPSLAGLFVLPAGPVPPNPQELLGRAGFAELLQSLIRDFDIVIMDTPAANEYAEAQTIAMGAAAALVLARKNHSTLPEIIKLTRSLQETRANLVGSVLNDF